MIHSCFSIGVYIYIYLSPCSCLHLHVLSVFFQQLVPVEGSTSVVYRTTRVRPLK